MQTFRDYQKGRHETLESVRRRLLAGRDPQDVVEVEQSLIEALRVQKDFFQIEGQ